MTSRPVKRRKKLIEVAILLEALLDDLESDKAECKESWAVVSPKKGRQAVCAFANDLLYHNAPGVLFVGAKDNDNPSHLSMTEQLLLTLSDIKTDGKIVDCATTSAHSGEAAPKGI